MFKSEKGASAVEFAIIAPLLFVLLFGIIEFGAVLYNQAVITNASREAARYAATFYTNPANATAERPDCADIKNYVATYVNAHMLNFTSSTPFGTDNVSCPNPDDSPQFYDDLSPEGKLAGYVDTIRVEYPYGFLVLGNLIGLLTPGGGQTWTTLTLRAQTSMRDENQGS
jgi:Flp pilus assembly protein TadG